MSDCYETMRRTMYLAPVVLGAGLAVATYSKSGRCEGGDSELQAVRHARELTAEGKGEEARESLVQLIASHPTSELLVLARADSYLSDKNVLWAQKVLAEYMAEHPPACGARAMAARLHIDQANLDLAEELLLGAACTKREEDRARYFLLRTEIAELRQDRAKVSELTAELRTAHRRYAEDDAPIQQRLRRADPYHQPALAWSGSVEGGWSQTGQGSMPSDLVVSERGRSGGSAAMELHLRGLVPLSGSVHITGEGGYRHHELWSETPRAFGTREPALAVGVMVGHGYPRTTFSYLYDAVWLSSGTLEGASNGWYVFRHGGSWRLLLDGSTEAFASLVYRSVKGGKRSGVQSESGLSRRFALSDTVSLTSTTTTRVAAATGREYRHLGAGELLQLSTVLPKGFELLQSLSVSGDVYPSSEGAGSERTGNRRDLFTRVTETWLFPSFGEWRLGAAYEYYHRESRGLPLDPTDHSVWLQLAYHSDIDRWSVSRVAEAGRVPLRHPKSSDDQVDQKDVRQVLRDDEMLRKSSSCLK